MYIITDVEDCIKQPTCDLCNVKFPTSSNLPSHKCTHSEEEQRQYQMRPFACKLCATRFRKKSEFTKHERVHTNERPYQCNFCEKRFTRKFHRKCHEKIHTQERPCKCTECGKCFVHQDQLDRHQRVHVNGRPFECTVCSKRLVAPVFIPLILCLFGNFYQTFFLLH